MSENPTTLRAKAIITELNKAQADIVQLLGELSPEDLALPTNCPGWTIRDQLGHIIDSTERLTGCFDKPEGTNGTFHPSEMAGTMEATARQRVQELDLAEIKRLFELAAADLLAHLQNREATYWEDLVPHPYLENCPAVQVAGFALLDWFIHPWDIRQALGRPPEPDPATAFLVATGLVGLLPKRLNPATATGLSGQFRYLVENMSGQTTARLDAVLADGKVTIERDAPPEKPADLVFKGPAGEMALAMLGRKPASGIIQPGPNNQQWLPRWGSLWISL